MKTITLIIISPLLMAVLIGCRGPTVNVAPIKVEPIHITMDINIKVDKELDDFFDFEDQLAATSAPNKDITPPVTP